MRPLDFRGAAIFLQKVRVDQKNKSKPIQGLEYVLQFSYARFCRNGTSGTEINTLTDRMVRLDACFILH